MRLPYMIDSIDNKLLKAKLDMLATRGKPQESFVASNIAEFKTSKIFSWMSIAEDYYVNDNDIIKKKRKALNAKGQLIEDKLLPNNILTHPSLRNMIDEKVNYVFGKPFTIKCENDTFRQILEDEIFTPKLRKRIKNLATDAYKKGISYLQPTFDKEGKLDFKLKTGDQIVPFWGDEEHTQLDAFILFFKITIYELDGNKTDVDYIEFVDDSGIYRYTMNDKFAIKPYEDATTPKVSGHFSVNLETDETKPERIQQMVWEKIPLIAFKANADEYPLIKSVKTLIDGYDRTTSDVADAIGDLPYSIKVIVNYDGQDLGELAANLYKYRMVKVTEGGDLKTLTQTIDITSINAHLDRLKDDMCEYGRTVNDKTAIATNASGKALDRIYNKIDLDGSDIITEFKDSLEQLLWFVKWYLKNSGRGDFENEKVEFVFNTDKPTDETTVIANCVASKGIISDETIIANHPWVTDVDLEKKKLEEQEQLNMNKLLNMGDYGTGTALNDEDTQEQDEEENQNQEE